MKTKMRTYHYTLKLKLGLLEGVHLVLHCPWRTTENICVRYDYFDYLQLIVYRHLSLQSGKT